MTVEYLLFACLITFIACFFIGKSFIQKAAIEYYKEQEKDHNEVLKYCLKQILTDAVETEDYETANRCQKLIENLNTYEKSNSKN